MVTEIWNQNIPKFEAALDFICGIIKGALNIFNIEGIIIPNVVNYSSHLIKNPKNFHKNQYLFTFNLNVFCDIKELNENKTKL